MDNNIYEIYAISSLFLLLLAGRLVGYAVAALSPLTSSPRRRRVRPSAWLVVIIERFLILASSGLLGFR
jgi:hypothetical protein